MAYSTEPVPTGSDPNATYTNLNDNALAANNNFGEDHVSFTAGANQGLHTRIRFPAGVSAPGATGDQQNIYPVGTGASLRIAVENATGSVDLTNLTTTVVGTAPYQFNRVVTPWGLILYYGLVARGVAASFTLTYTNASEVTQYASITGVGSGSTRPFLVTIDTSSPPAVLSFNLGSASLTSVSLFLITKIP